MEGSGVDPDADGDAPVLRLGGDLLDLRLLAEVARVESEALDTRLQCGQRHLVVEVDVGDDRNRRAGHDPGQTLGGGLLVARAPHQVGAGGGERVDLGQGGFGVGGLGGGHRLHGDRGAAADGNGAHVDLTGGPPLGRGPGRASHASMLGRQGLSEAPQPGGQLKGLAIGWRMSVATPVTTSKPRNISMSPGERHQLGHIGVVHRLAMPGADPLVDRDGHMAAVERQHGEEVEDTDEHVDEDEDVAGGRRCRPGRAWSRVRTDAHDGLGAGAVGGRLVGRLGAGHLVEPLGHPARREEMADPDDRRPGDATEIAAGGAERPGEAGWSAPANRGSRR